MKLRIIPRREATKSDSVTRRYQSGSNRPDGAVVLRPVCFFVFAATVGYLRAGARVVSHEAFNHSPRFWRIGRVLSICPIIGNSIGNCPTAGDACQDG